MSQNVLPALLEVRIMNLRSRIDQNKPGKKKNNSLKALYTSVYQLQLVEVLPCVVQIPTINAAVQGSDRSHHNSG